MPYAYVIDIVKKFVTIVRTIYVEISMITNEITGFISKKGALHIACHAFR